MNKKTKYVNPILFITFLFIIISCDKGKEPYRKAEVAELSKHYEQALNLYKKVLEYHNSDFFDQAKDKVIELEKKLRQVNDLLSQSKNALINEKFDNAIEMLAKADSILPDYKESITVYGLYKNAKIEFFIKKGDEFVQKREFNSAEEWYKKIPEIDKQDPRFQEKLKYLEIEKSKIPYTVKVSDTEGFGGRFAKVSNTSFTKNQISFDLLNSYIGGMIHGIYFQIKIVWKRRNGKTGTLIGNDQYISNGQSKKVVLDFPYGHSLPDDVIKININIDQFLQRFY
jgi:tetratricopeptide (TPR) repeat protein